MRLLRFAVPMNAVFAPEEGPEAGSCALTLEARRTAEGITQTVRLWSDAYSAPLSLAASGLADGAEAALLVHPWRTEFWAEGKLFDEEWPAGDLPLFRVSPSVFNRAGIRVTDDPCADDRANLPLRGGDFRTDCGISANDGSPVLIGRLLSGNGENSAEGWKPSDPGVFAGDCMPYTDVDADGEERYHVLYLKDRRHHRSKWGKGAHQWAHLSTRDFRNWDLHPLAVSVDDPAEGSVCTGSFLKTGEGLSCLYYTIRQVDGSPAPLLRSVSEDGYRFRRDPGFRFVLSSRYHGGSARDPKIVAAEDGSFHMFVTTSLMTGEQAGRGCLAHLVSENGADWRETDPIYVSPDGDQPECSDYFRKDGWYYLIFSHRGTGQYRMSREPFSGWQMPGDPRIPCESVPKMALWKGRILFAGFSRIEGYAGTLTFAEAWQNPDGTLRFEA